jgi:hypothetical protein
MKRVLAMRTFAKICVVRLILLGLFSVSLADEHEFPPFPYSKYWIQEDPGLNVYNGPIPDGDRILFIATDGDDENPGTEAEPWATLHHAIEQVQQGDVLVVRGGIYFPDDILRINSPFGTEEQRIVLMAYPGEIPILDFSQLDRVSNNHGIRLNAWYWHLIGLTIRNAAHNGIRMDGSHNILDQLTAYNNHDTGIHMAGTASHNLIRNSDSFHNFNYDPARTPRIGNNADGFGAKFDGLGPGNRYHGCRAWNNSDDGYDFWRAHHTIVVENSWAFANGDASVFGEPEDFAGAFEGNGNGFKLGGDHIHTPHIVVRSKAFENFGSDGQAKGFDFNNNLGAMTLLHNTAYNNGRNIFFPATIEGQALFVNNISFESNVIANLPLNAAQGGNSWQSDSTVTEDSFLSVDTELARGPREADGSLPDIPLLVPAPGSFLVDGGVAIGEPFYGDAPDIGVYEFATGELVDPWIDIGSGMYFSDLRVFDMEFGAHWSIQEQFESDIPAFGEGSNELESDFTISSISDRLHIDEWIRPSIGTRTKNFLRETAEVTLLENRHVFIAHSDDISASNKPEWLAEYESSDMKIVLTDPAEAEREMTVYIREVSANETIVLGRNSMDGTAGAPMYLVLAGSYDPLVTSVERDQADKQNELSVAVYPNPFNAAANVTYTIGRPSHVRLHVYDVTGRLVETLVDGIVESGSYTEVFTGSNLASGVYFVRLIAGRDVLHQRMLLMK